MYVKKRTRLKKIPINGQLPISVGFFFPAERRSISSFLSLHSRLICPMSSPFFHSPFFSFFYSFLIRISHVHIPLSCFLFSYTLISTSFFFIPISLLLLFLFPYLFRLFFSFFLSFLYFYQTHLVLCQSLS